MVVSLGRKFMEIYTLPFLDVLFPALFFSFSIPFSFVTLYSFLMFLIIVNLLVV